nr:40S ribosomal protein S6 [Cryptomonas curvata]
MKLNISNPKNGMQKTVEIEDQNNLRIFYDKYIKSEINVDSLGPEWIGYILKITGGQDKQGFPMKHGILTNRRVKLLLHKGDIGCKGYFMKKGERRRKSVRGCIVSTEIEVLNLSIVKEGNDIPGLTGISPKKNFGPKRASKIRKLFTLTKGEDLTTYIVKKNSLTDTKIIKLKQPKIQRLITPLKIQRKRYRISKKKKDFLKTKLQLLEFGKKFT